MCGCLMRIRPHYRLPGAILALMIAATSTAAADDVKPPKTPASNPAVDKDASSYTIDPPVRTADILPDPPKVDAPAHPRDDTPEVGFLEFYGISDTDIWIILTVPICLGAVGFYLIRRRLTRRKHRRRRRVVV